ncbi:MAG: hypothetical protein WC792_02330 [Candidatus Micrarchaeia archaeon]|jgi:hypothetical protein
MDFTVFGKKVRLLNAILAIFAAAVIVLLLANYVWIPEDGTCSSCLAEQRGNLQRLAQTIFADESAQTNLPIILPTKSCCGIKVEGLRFAHYYSREFCGRCSANSSNGCWKIEPVGYDRDGKLMPLSNADVCLNPPAGFDVDTKNCENNALNFVNSPCPNQSSPQECQKLSYLQPCDDGSWDFPDGGCKGTNGVAGVAEFKTLQIDKTTNALQIALTTTAQGNKTIAHICATPYAPKTS